MASDDLNTTNWFPIGIMGATNGTWRFFDASGNDRPHHFYRAVQLP